MYIWIIYSVQLCASQAQKKVARSTRGGASRKEQSEFKFWIHTTTGIYILAIFVQSEKQGRIYTLVQQYFFFFTLAWLYFIVFYDRRCIRICYFFWRGTTNFPMSLSVRRSVCHNFLVKINCSPCSKIIITTLNIRSQNSAKTASFSKTNSEQVDNSEETDNDPGNPEESAT